MRTVFRVLAIIVILVSGGLLLWVRGEMNAVPGLTGEFAEAFDQFAASSYLQSLWSEVCAYPLQKENVVLIAVVDETGGKPTLRCQWLHVPMGAQEEIGVEIAESVTDVHADWLQCGFDDAFAETVRSAVHEPGSSRVHLGQGLATDVLLSYVLVGKCHYWDAHYCEEYGGGRLCELENSSEILSVAYAVLDPHTQTVFW